MTSYKDKISELNQLRSKFKGLHNQGLISDANKLYAKILSLDKEIKRIDESLGSTYRSTQY